MYADDLVLFSTSETGLQSCLNKLSIFCASHGLIVNLNRLISLFLAKVGENLKHFLFNDVELKEVQTYKY